MGKKLHKTTSSNNTLDIKRAKLSALFFFANVFVIIGSEYIDKCLGLKFLINQET